MKASRYLRASRSLTLTTALLGTVGLVSAETLLVTGEVASMRSQYVLAPQTSSWRTQLTYLAKEGDRVEPGDLIMQVDGTSIESRQRSAEDDLARYQAESQRDLARLELAYNQAELDLQRASIEQQIAKMKAEVPAAFIGELEYQERQLTLEQSDRSVTQEQEAFDNANQRLTDKRNEIKLAVEHKTQQLQIWDQMLAGVEIRAEQPGFVLHRSNPWTGTKYQTGDQVQTSWEIAMVADDSALQVIAWINAIDIPKVNLGSAVQLRFDALPTATVEGRISFIPEAGEGRQLWGKGLYHRAIVDLPDDHQLSLLPGMSVQVQIAAQPVSPQGLLTAVSAEGD